ncbi:AFG2-interacting ribosome maturation factor isoform X1 [Phycodurus eques]|uniref:AFG2-interacting ribosome maturation factor isoform X1 n=1 Tax=Phycodurus eques TaxID=693459 RepID=UPI002ACED267|nr:AFG2-interacting ribosome maturation factor isoform X1 [Phycodurus eques]
MSKSALLTIHQVLRRCFHSLENNQKLWMSVVAECIPLMASLENLAEQSRALSNVQISNTPLKDFPQVEELLRFKLSQAMDTVLCKLHQNIDSLATSPGCTTPLGQSQLGLLLTRNANEDKWCSKWMAVCMKYGVVSTAVQLYEQNTDSLDLVTVTERSATVPSVIDMMEWLHNAARHYRQQFTRRKILLHTLSSYNLNLLVSATKRWKDLDTPSAEDQITDALCKVSFFMESG